MPPKKSAWFLCIPLLFISACNVYTPLASPASDEEYVEEGRKCLASSDYDCAITQYNRISSATLKNQQLCLVNISKAGIGLSALTNVLLSSSARVSTMILLANQVLLRGYTDAKLTGAVDAVTNCALLGTDDTSTLLKALSRVTDCGVRVAKSNYLVATDDTVTATCNAATAGRRTGTMGTADVGGDGAGTLSVANPGMCYADVQLCVDDMTAANTLLTGSSFSALKDNLAALPGPLIGGGTGSGVVMSTRVGLKAAVN